MTALLHVVGYVLWRHANEGLRFVGAMVSVAATVVGTGYACRRAARWIGKAPAATREKG